MSAASAYAPSGPGSQLAQRSPADVTTWDARNTVVTRYQRNPQRYRIPANYNPNLKHMAHGTLVGKLDDGGKIVHDVLIDHGAPKRRATNLESKDVNVIGATLGERNALLRIKKGDPLFTVVAYDPLNTRLDSMADQHGTAFTSFNGLRVDRELAERRDNAGFRRLIRYVGLSDEEKNVNTPGSTIGAQAQGRIETRNNGLCDFYIGDLVVPRIPDVDPLVRAAERAVEPYLMSDYPRERYGAVFEPLDPMMILQWPQIALTKHVSDPKAMRALKELAPSRQGRRTIPCDELFALRMRQQVLATALVAVATLAQYGLITINDPSSAASAELEKLTTEQINKHATAYANEAKVRHIAGKLGLTSKERDTSINVADTIFGRAVCGVLADAELQTRFSLGASVVRPTQRANPTDDVFTRPALTPATYLDDLVRTQRDGMCQSLVAYELARLELDTQVIGRAYNTSEGGKMSPLVIIQ